MLKSGLNNRARYIGCPREYRGGGVPGDALDRCLAYLRSAESLAVKEFFDDLSRRRPVFQGFMAKAG